MTKPRQSAKTTKSGGEKAGRAPAGPKPDTVKIEGDWELAINKALKKDRPKDGWPKSDKDRP